MIGEAALTKTMYDKIIYMNDVNPDYVVLGEKRMFWEYKSASASCCHAFASLMCEWILKAVFGMDKVDENGISLIGDGLQIKATAKIPFGDKIFEIDRA